MGKTVLLNRIANDAEARGVVGVRFKAPEGRVLPVALAPQLRRALLALDRGEAAKEHMRRAWSGLAGFIAAARVKYGAACLRRSCAPASLSGMRRGSRENRRRVCLCRPRRIAPRADVRDP